MDFDDEDDAAILDVYGNFSVIIGVEIMLFSRVTKLSTAAQTLTATKL